MIIITRLTQCLSLIDGWDRASRVDVPGLKAMEIKRQVNKPTATICQIGKSVSVVYDSFELNFN